jgi:hypothetical protein
VEYPYVQVVAHDVTNPEVSCAVTLRVESPGYPVPNVSEQDVVDALKALFAQQPNVSATATRFEVTTSPA